MAVADIPEMVAPAIEKLGKADWKDLGGMNDLISTTPAAGCILLFLIFISYFILYFMIKFVGKLLHVGFILACLGVTMMIFGMDVTTVYLYANKLLQYIAKSLTTTTLQ